MGMNNTQDIRGDGITTVTLNKGVKMDVMITLGFVMVYVPEYDCTGMQRTIDFPRIGRHTSRKPTTHRSCEKYIAVAYRAAITAMAKADYAGKLQ